MRLSNGKSTLFQFRIIYRWVFGFWKKCKTWVISLVMLYFMWILLSYQVFHDSLKEKFHVNGNTTFIYKIASQVSTRKGVADCSNSSCSSITQKSLGSVTPTLNDRDLKKDPKLSSLKSKTGDNLSDEDAAKNVPSSLENSRIPSQDTLKKKIDLKSSKEALLRKLPNLSPAIAPEENPLGTLTEIIATKTITHLAGAEEPKPVCPSVPPSLQGMKDLRPPAVPPAIKDIEKKNPLVSGGGHYMPPDCKARSKVAIIIPFRNRDEHLHHFLFYMHPILQRQQLDYRIYVINQFGKGKFNRAKLLNVGYVESIKDYNFECFAFHDVDLILENDKVLYTCPPQPRHLASGMSKFDYKLIYEGFFGGACELTREQFERVNGFSNDFWGWGAEDDDLYKRVLSAGMKIIRYPIEISRYLMFKHSRDKGNEVNPKMTVLVRKSATRMKYDGLNSLHYQVKSRQEHPLYTNITVNIFAPDV